MPNKDSIMIKTGLGEMDFEKVTSMLANSYWSPGIAKETVIKAAANSALVAGLFSESGEQIGYARVVSDRTRFAYLMDVIIDEQHRRQGLGQILVRSVLENEELCDVCSWGLKTKDAHGVYAKFGFTAPEFPETIMELKRPR